MLGDAQKYGGIRAATLPLEDLASAAFKH